MKRWIAWLLTVALCMAGFAVAEELSAQGQTLLSALTRGLGEGFTVLETITGDLYGDESAVLCAAVKQESIRYLVLLQNEDAPILLKENLLLTADLAQSIELYVDDSMLYIRQDGGAPDAPWSLLLVFALIDEVSLGISQMASGQPNSEGKWDAVNPTLIQLTLTQRTEDNTGEHEYSFYYLEQSYVEIEWPDAGGETVFADLGLEAGIVPPDFATFDIHTWPMLYADLLDLFGFETDFVTEPPMLVELLQYSE